VFDPKVIHILGASGSGTTTLGKAICERYGYTHLDTDDFFWLPTDPKFTMKREPSERRRLLSKAIDKAEWIKMLSCPVIVVDGTKPAEEMLEKVGLSNG
jgi:adenylate kinase family enzyme